MEGVDYGAFIVPGLIMLTVLTQSVSNAAFGIYFPKFIGSIEEILSAPISFIEVVIGYVGAAATKSLLVGTVVLVTAFFFVDIEIRHPFWMVAILVTTCITFALLGFIVGIWADNFEQLQLVPLLVVTPLVFLGGSFYSVSMLPPAWQTVTMFNPVVYLISGFRWAFFGETDISLALSFTMTLVFLVVALGGDLVDIPDGVADTELAAPPGCHPGEGRDPLLVLGDLRGNDRRLQQTAVLTLPAFPSG